MFKLSNVERYCKCTVKWTNPATDLLNHMSFLWLKVLHWRSIILLILPNVVGRNAQLIIRMKKPSPPYQQESRFTLISSKHPADLPLILPWIWFLLSMWWREVLSLYWEQKQSKGLSSQLEKIQLWVPLLVLLTSMVTPINLWLHNWVPKISYAWEWLRDIFLP